MRFERDEGKSEVCFLLRGFDFAHAAHAFADPDRIVRQDIRYSDGEDRYTLTGRIEGRLYVLAYTPRAGTIRIIPARKANQREIARYEDRTDDD